MNGYTIIADTSELLIKRLQEKLVPNIIPNKNSIILCTPEERGDASLGLYLYHVKETEEVRQVSRLNTGLRQQSKPPMYLSLSYMLTAYSSSEVKFRMLEEQKILGAALQYFYDYPLLERERLYGESEFGLEAQIRLMRLETDERSKLWSFKDITYKPSLFFNVTPVLMQSDYKVPVSRVLEAEFHVENRGDL